MKRFRNGQERQSGTIRRDPATLVVAQNAVGWIGKPNGTIWVDDDIVRRIERLAIILISDRGNRAGVLVASHSPPRVFAGKLPPFEVERVTVAITRGVGLRRARSQSAYGNLLVGLCQIVKKLVRLNRLPYVEFLTGFLHHELQEKPQPDGTMGSGKRNGRFLYRARSKYVNRLLPKVRDVAWPQTYLSSF